MEVVELHFLSTTTFWNTPMEWLFLKNRKSLSCKCLSDAVTLNANSGQRRLVLAQFLMRPTTVLMDFF
jgi:hypothetical protein